LNKERKENRQELLQAGLLDAQKLERTKPALQRPWRQRLRQISGEDGRELMLSRGDNGEGEIGVGERKEIG